MDELSEREREVLVLLAEGKRNRQIATELYIGTETVKTHLKSIFRKLGVNTRGEAICAAYQHELATTAPQHRTAHHPPTSEASAVVRPAMPPPLEREGLQTHLPGRSERHRPRRHASAEGRGLMTQTSRRLLDETTIELLTGLIAAMPGCDTASVTVIERGVATSLASVDEFAEAADAAQYAADSGPALTTARTRQPAGIDRIIAGVGRYEEFREGALALGVASTLSVPIPGVAFSSLNLYSRTPRVFDDAAEEAAVMGASHLGDETW